MCSGKLYDKCMCGSTVSHQQFNGRLLMEMCVMIPDCVCFCIWFLVYCIWFMLVYHVLCHVLFFHALLCLSSFKSFLCSPLWLPLSVVLFPPGLFLCAPPPRYHTWLPSSSLSSPGPLHVISVCVFPSLLVRSLSLFSVCILSLVVHAPVHAPVRTPVPCLVCFGFEFSMFELNFDFWFVLCLAVFFCCYFVLLVLFCYFAFCPMFVFAFSFCLIKARLLSPWSLPSCVSAFGSTFPFHSFPL